MKFKARPVEIEATQWHKLGDHPAVYAASYDTDLFFVRGAQGDTRVHPCDWIITEPRGDGYYPCNREVFEAKYEPAGADTDDLTKFAAGANPA